MSEPIRGRSSKLEVFEDTVIPHMHAAYNLARWLLRTEADAQDAVQEAFLRAYRFFDGFHGGEPKAWLLAIVRNTCMTWQRRNKRGEASVPFDEVVHSTMRDSPSVEEKLIAADRAGALQECIERLPWDYREVLVLREIEEMSYKEIAEAASIPVGTVMSRLARARQRLSGCLRGRPKGAEA